MSYRLLRLALPLVLFSAVPAAQVLLERIVLAGTEECPTALGCHAVLIGAATLLFLFLNGPNVHAVVAIARLRQHEPEKATVFAQNTIAFSGYTALLSFLLIPLAPVLSTFLLGRAPSEDEVDSARLLLGVVALLLLQHAALAHVLAAERVWSAVLVLASGLLVHAALLIIVPAGSGLTGVMNCRAAGAVVSVLFATHLSPVPKSWPLRSPVVRRDKAVHLELLLRGTAVGLHAAVGSFVVGIVFFIALARSGEAALAAAALAFSWYSLLSAVPVGVAQGAGILTAEALGQKDSTLVRLASKTGERICGDLGAAICIGFLVAASVYWWLLAPVPGSCLAVALMGISVHASIDGKLQAQVWSLRALGRQRGILLATLVAALLYGATLVLVTETYVSWLLLAGYDFILSLLLLRILAQSLPAEPRRRGMTSWETACPPATPHGDDTAAEFSTHE
jgi:Na+-driven multidrug efflux pump